VGRVKEKGTKKMTWKFNAKKFINDCGGPNQIAHMLEKSRTAPYRMMNTRYMTTLHFEQLKNASIHLKIDDYFEQDGNNDEPKSRAKGATV
tara:strand:+ start:240 stop:512 length:273 start_codon:yes stop_codon:yes gene_type:complete